jgi:hypothetical protein
MLKLIINTLPSRNCDFVPENITWNGQRWREAGHFKWRTLKKHYFRQVIKFNVNSHKSCNDVHS